MFHPSAHLHGPPLNLLQEVQVFSVLRMTGNLSLTQPVRMQMVSTAAGTFRTVSVEHCTPDAMGGQGIMASSRRFPSGGGRDMKADAEVPSRVTAYSCLNLLLSFPARPSEVPACLYKDTSPSIRTHDSRCTNHTREYKGMYLLHRYISTQVRECSNRTRFLLSHPF